MSETVRELYPRQREVAAESVYSALGLGQLYGGKRPYTVVNMVSSLDGHATLAGKSGGLSGGVDRKLFSYLRTQVDAVMVGATTLAVEKYGRLVRDPELRKLRERQGLMPDPLAVVVSGSHMIDPEIPLMANRDSEVVVLSTQEATTTYRARLHTEIFPGATVPLDQAMACLTEKYGVKTVLLEGGPTLNGVMFTCGLIDELFLTLSSKVIGGRGIHIVEAAETLPGRPAELVSLYQHGSCLYTRYRF